MKTFITVVSISLVLFTASLARASAVSILGEQDYPNGTVITSNGTWNTAQGGEPYPFDTIHVATKTITFTHTGLDTGREGYLTFALWDLDAEFSGSQVTAFLLDGIPQSTSGFEISGTDLIVKEFTFLVAASYFADGELEVTLTFSGPPSGNEVGIDFSRVELPPTPACVPPPDDLIAWWSGEGNGDPEVGSFTALTANGASYTGGRVGQSFQFDGINDFVDIGTHGVLHNYTVALWFKADIVDTNRTFISQDREGTNDDFMLGIEPEGHFYTSDFRRITVVFQDFPSFNRFKIRDTVDVVPGQWYFVAVTYDGATMRLWVNGIEKGSVPASGLSTADQRWNLGQNPHYFPSGVYRNFAGRIDEPIIASRAFSGPEINAIYTAGASGLCKDTTSPEIVPTINGTEGANGWYVSDVTLSWSITDPESDVSETIGCDLVNVTSDTIEATFTCSATSVGGNATQSVTVKRDATPPEVSCGTADGSWYGADISIACSSDDATSGLAMASEASLSLSTAVAPGTETADAATNSVIVCDVAGNCAAAGPVEGNKIDKKAPTITIVSPTSGNYLLNEQVLVSYSCNDGGSGVSTCNGTTANGAALDTASIGSKTFTVSSSDSVGNSAAAVAVSYVVNFGVVALHDQTKAHKSGSTIPIKIRLVDATGSNVSSPSMLPHAIAVIQTSSSASYDFGDAGNSNPDFDFRYDAGLGGYIFNLQTTGMSTGTYTLNFVAGGTTVYMVGFQIRQ